MKICPSSNFLANRFFIDLPVENGCKIPEFGNRYIYILICVKAIRFKMGKKVQMETIERSLWFISGYKVIAS